MKITVKNFGPIREARNVEVGPMTIFVGPSNTGKSYLAMLIYSIHEVLADDYLHWGLIHPFKNSDGSYIDWLDRLRDSTPKSTNDEVRKIYVEWAQMVSETWKKKMVYCFGEEGKKLIEGNSAEKRFEVKVSCKENQTILVLSSPEKSKITLQKCRQISDKISAYVPQLAEVDDYESKAVRETVYADIYQEIFYELILVSFQRTFLPWKSARLPVDSFYLPAIRGGVMQSHRTLVSSLIERAPVAGLTDSLPIPLFNGVLSDFIMGLIKIGSKDLKYRDRSPRGLNRIGEGNRREFYSDYKMEQISSEIEQKIISGQIEIERSEAQYPDFRYKFTREDSKYDLPLMSASSSVSELAPISLFIRHYVCPNDLFIVEEPEANLHPGAQREISDVLVKLVNAGVNVLITTHSDNILEQISNFIYADWATVSAKTKLDEDKCKTYLFKPAKKSKRTTVEAISFNPETGIVPEDHLKVSSDLYNETVELMEQCENARNKTDI